MPLTVLSVAYSLSPVGTAASGGAEHVVEQLDRGLVARGHRSIVIAQEGSRVRGELVAVPQVRKPLSHDTRRRAQANHLEAITSVLEREQVDVLHLHGVDFASYLPDAPGVATIVTVHLPRDWYDERARDLSFDGVRFVCVSRSQAAAWPGRGLEVIENGVPLHDFGADVIRRDFALLLGRICPEKGWHDGLDAARRASVRAVLAGNLHGFPEHEQYLRDEIVPRLSWPDAVYVGECTGHRKRHLLASARCVVVPSSAPETCSLVAIEALASGTPVVAFARGALPEVIAHGRNGFLVHDVEQMAHAIRSATFIHAEECRQSVTPRFDAARMVDDYLSLYEDEFLRRARDRRALA